MPFDSTNCCGGTALVDKEMAATGAAVGVWAEGQALSFNIALPAERSDTVTTVLVADARHVQPLLDYAREKCGVVLGVGIGELSGRAIRIATWGTSMRP